ncbi:MAG: aldehyde reductase [Rhizobiaceae bacterium]|nr:aldehyde reductase [Rhizobiaceae bacterium]
MPGSLVLVTGGSGFIGVHCIAKLLEAGYRVRATVRSAKREPEIRAMLARAGIDAGNRLETVLADLMSDVGWREAVSGCTYVLHIASPLPHAQPANPDELIVPAREGTLRVLRAARDAHVRRVVLTSSFAAIGYGHAPRSQPYTEEDWTDETAVATPYIKSKTIAERAAWAFVHEEGNGLELAVVNPVVVLGPVLGADYSASIALIGSMLEGRVPFLPRLMLGIVDVRDVADLHLAAMTAPQAAGERFLAVADGFMSMRDIAGVLKAGLGSAASRVSTRVLPDWVVRVAALFSASARLAAGPELGRIRNASSAKAQDVLGWKPRPREEAILSSARSLLDLGLVKGGSQKPVAKPVERD